MINITNFLEQLAFEWLSYQGYFVRSNIKFNKRLKGGYEGEIDVLGYDPKNNTLIHIETSMDSDSNAYRIEKFNRKFNLDLDFYNNLLNTNATSIEQVAVVGFSKTVLEISDRIIHKPVPDFINEITDVLKYKHPMKEAVPENLSLLRAIQFSHFYNSKS